jgi:hypothetical protein
MKTTCVELFAKERNVLVLALPRPSLRFDK